MFGSIAGKSCIVTGGSRGIGKGIAKAFASKGANVMVVARGESAAKETVNEIISAGGSADYHCCNVANWSEVQALFLTTFEKMGSIDIVCANAGIFPLTPIEKLSPEEWDQVQETNVKGTFLCVKAALPYFKEAGCGRVVVTSSVTGPVTGFPGWSHYGASKAAQLGFIKTAAIELADYNATINAIMPGNTNTETLDKLGEEFLKAMAEDIPLKRIGSVNDISNAALFLASDEAAFITGQQLIVDGGQTLPESSFDELPFKISL